MPEFCTCGAQLPADALFCHKCGKPQRELAGPEIREEAVAPPAPEAFAPPPPPEAAALGFRNPVALRISLLVAVVATFLGWLPFLNWLGAGFFSVFFYRRKTRGVLNLNAGLHLGWITGVIMFGLWSIVFAAMGAMGQLQAMFREQLRNMPANDPAVQQVAAFFESGPGMAVMLGLGFVLITCFSMAGGALGAKLVGRNSGA